MQANQLRSLETALHSCTVRLSLALVFAAFLAACDRGASAVDATTCDHCAAADVSDTFDAANRDAPIDTGPPPPSMPASAPLVQWVDPFVATGGQGYGTGSAFPGPQRPFGMVRPGPDTTDPAGAPSFAHCSGYAYADPMIQGFSLTRLHGTGIPEYGAVALMPTVGMSPAKTNQTGYRSAFSHANETASPGYYAVTLDDTNVRVELTATDHVALERYAFPIASDAVVLLDVGHTIGDVTITDGSVTIDPTAREVSGFAHFEGGYSRRFGGVNVYFVVRFAQPFARFGVWQSGTVSDGALTQTGGSSGAYLAFDASTDGSVVAAAAISFVDVAHARMNLDAEAPSLDFDASRTAATSAWEQVLGVVHVSGRDMHQFRTFYSALYHTLLMPTLASDVDGSYRGMDTAVHVASGFRYYTDFSLWDTYRTLHPLLTLLYPQYELDMMRSLTQMGIDGGSIDSWPLGDGYTGGMLGDNADVVFADGWVKGLRDFDLRSAYDAVRPSAVGPLPAGTRASGRTGIDDYLSLGYVSIESGGSSAAATLEYSLDDHALSILAGALGESADAATFEAHSHNWQNLWDPTSQFLLGRHHDGTFPSMDNPLVWQPYYAEGDAWQYLWLVPHDLDGLAQTMGGRDALLARLDMFFGEAMRRGTNTFFPMPYYWPGNEPDIHTPWIYAALDDTARTARWTRWSLANFFNDTPAGLPGNDDSGTMSAFYVFSALGIYAIPTLDQYLVGSPIFTHADLALSGGTFSIDAPDSSDAAIYPSNLTLDGAPLSRPRIPHATMVAGGTLHLDMATSP